MAGAVFEEEEEEEEEEQEALAPADPGAVRAMRLGTHPAVAVASVMLCLALCGLFVRAAPTVHPTLEVAGWSTATYFIMIGASITFVLARCPEARAAARRGLARGGRCT